MKYIYIKYKDGHSATCEAQIIALKEEQFILIDEMLHTLTIPAETVEQISIHME